SSLANSVVFFFFLLLVILRRPPLSTLFPYTTLFRSLSDLEALGYAARPFVIPACAVDAPHRRDRVWVVAHAEGAGCETCIAHGIDRKSTRLNSSHVKISYAVFCLKKKTRSTAWQIRW